MEEDVVKSEQEAEESIVKQTMAKWLGKIKQIKVDDFKFELTLFFILGFLLGFTLKTEASKKITIGFEDYKVLRAKQGYDLEKLQSDLEKKAAEGQAAQQLEQPAQEPQQ